MEATITVIGCEEDAQPYYSALPIRGIKVTASSAYGHWTLYLPRDHAAHIHVGQKLYVNLCEKEL